MAPGQIVCRVNQVTVTRPDCVPINLFGGGRPEPGRAQLREHDLVRRPARHRDSTPSPISTATFAAVRAAGRPDPLRGRRRVSPRDGAPSRPIAVVGECGRWRHVLQRLPPFNPPAFEGDRKRSARSRSRCSSDLPFAQELTVTAAARYSDYNTGRVAHLRLQHQRHLGSGARYSLPGELFEVGPRSDAERSHLPGDPELQPGRRSVRCGRLGNGSSVPRGKLRRAGCSAWLRRDVRQYPDHRDHLVAAIPSFRKRPAGA